jgi:hypothetical protein
MLKLKTFVLTGWFLSLWATACTVGDLPADPLVNDARGGAANDGLADAPESATWDRATDVGTQDGNTDARTDPCVVLASVCPNCQSPLIRDVCQLALDTMVRSACQDALDDRDIQRDCR